MKYVYLLRAGESYYKVGISTNVDSRLKAVQTSNANQVEIVTTRLVTNANLAEKIIHQELSEMKANGGREWFKLTPEQALELAVLINKNPQPDISKQISVRHILNEHKAHVKFLEDKIDLIISTLKSQGIKPEFPVELPPPPKTLELPPDSKALREHQEQVAIEEAKRIIVESGRASTSYLQRRMRIGYGRAARIMDELEAQGVIGAADGSNPRQILLGDIV